MLIESREVTISNGKRIIIRSATGADAQSLSHHRYITSGETYFMARYPEECSFDIADMEQKLLYTQNSICDFMITAFFDNEVVGDLGVTQLRNLTKYCHRAYMGISIQKQYCNMGLGSIMIECAVKQAKKNGFEQLELGVFEDNAEAIRLYEKFGFQKYVIQKRAFKLKDGTYRDELIIVKML